MATTELVKRQLPSEVAYTDQANNFLDDILIGDWSSSDEFFFDVASVNSAASLYAEEKRAILNLAGYGETALISYGDATGNADNDKKAVLEATFKDAFEYRTANTAPHIFKVNGTERARINSSGMDVTGDFTVNGSPISGSGISKEEAIAYAIALG